MPVPLEACAAIVLAAGSSQRFGADNKLLAEFCGAPLLSHALAVLSDLPLTQKLVVTGHDRDRVAALAKSFGIRTVFYPHHRAGMGGSIACGARMLSETVEGAFIVPGDMPLITRTHFADLAQHLHGPDAICRPVIDGQPGHPVLFGRAYFARLAELSGETGAREIIAGAADRLVGVAQRDFSGVFDIDRPTDLNR